MTEFNYDPEKVGEDFYRSKSPLFPDSTEWVRYGIEHGWCGPPVCETHDGTPMSDEEADAFNEGDDICIHIIRMYEDEKHKASIEEAHSPSKWRNHYTG